MKKIIFALTFLVVGISCHRFEDGPLISFRSIEKRMNGTWKIESLYINGMDQTQTFIDSCGDIISIVINKSGDQWGGDIYIRSLLDTICFGTYFTLGGNKLDHMTMGHIGCGYYNSYCNTGFSFCMKDSSTNMNIAKLTNKKLWLKYHDYEGDNILKLNKL
jgi:hypothetical protein